MGQVEGKEKKKKKTGKKTPLRKVHKGLAGRMGLFYEDDKVPSSPVVLSFKNKKSRSKVKDSVFDVTNFESGEGSVIAAPVVRCILFHLPPSDMINGVLVSHVFHNCFCSNSFWKEYHDNYYLQEDGVEIEDGEGAINWKKKFYQRLVLNRDSVRANQHYFKMYNPKPPVGQRSGKKILRFAIVGNEGIGSENWVGCICKGAKTPNWDTGECLHFFVGRDTLLSKTSVKVFMFTSNQKNVSKKRPPFSIPNVDGYFLCFNIHDKASFDILERYVNLINKSRKEREETMKKKTDRHRSPVLLVGMTQNANDSNYVVSESSIIDFVKQHLLKGYIECSFGETSDDTTFLPMGVMLQKAQSDIRRKSGPSSIPKKRTRGKSSIFMFSSSLSRSLKLKAKKSK